MTRAVDRWVTTIAVVFAVVGLVAAWLGSTQTSGTDLTRDISAGLRCPTCIGDSVADSASPVAEAMKLVVAEQVAEGYSATEIRAWFAERYGDHVLLEPPRRGVGWMLWVVPGVLVVAVAVRLVIGRAGRQPWLITITITAMTIALVVIWALPSALAWSSAASLPLSGGQANSAQLHEEVEHDPAVVLANAVAAEPADIELRLALANTLSSAGRFDEALTHHRAAQRLKPLDADVAYRHAFTLREAGMVDQAVVLLEEVLLLDSDHVAAILLLAAAQGGSAGIELLDSFRGENPDHGAVPLVEQLREQLDTAS